MIEAARGKGNSVGAKNTTGIVDAPLGQDWLNIQPYVEGLSGFIRTCQTPMTIAVQGDWGTGKTNMMLLSEQELAPHAHFRLSDPPAKASGDSSGAPVYTIRFNTWQYSQFDMQGRLVGSLLENIGAHLLLAEPERRGAEKRQAFLRALLPIASNAGLSILETGLGAVGLGAFKGLVKQISDALTTRDRVRNDDAAAVLVDVKAKFADAVEELVTPETGSSPVGRLVIFIDDLDRLEPRKAVELMEALKLFLDVPHCVFVLAIDFSVVQQGVTDKYGSRMGRAKARSFFDKIIQVPFQMPVGAYGLGGFFDELVDQTGIEISEGDRASFVGLIQHSIGNNPRSIKRLMNTFMLLRDIAVISRAAGAAANGEQQVIDRQLFAVLCLQTAYPDAYLALASERVEDSDLYQMFFLASDGDPVDTGGSKRAVSALLSKAGIEPGGRRFGLLADAIAAQFQKKGEFDSAMFEQALSQAITTSSGADSETTKSKRGPKVYGAGERRERIASKAPWAAEEGALDLPERFCAVLEQSSNQVRIGVPESDTQGWVIEVGRKRAGMLQIRQKFVHVFLEPRWFAEQQPGFFYQKFRERFADLDLSERVKPVENGAFGVMSIQPTEVELMDKLAAFWADMISEDLKKR